MSVCLVYGDELIAVSALQTLEHAFLVMGFYRLICLFFPAAQVLVEAPELQLFESHGDFLW